MKVLLVDPSLYTAPYDAGVNSGLQANGLDVAWAVRPLRPGEDADLPVAVALPMFYRKFDRATFLPKPLRGVFKGFAHIVGLFRLMAWVRRHRPDVVHFQWTVLPLVDRQVMRWLKARGIGVVVTTHDTQPFNGQKRAALEVVGFDVPIRAADRVIVHTRAAADVLVTRGIDPAKISVVPHGPLPVPELPADRIPPQRTDGRITFVLFGQLKWYKGIDLLIEAMARLAPDVRARTRVIIAGAAHMDVDPLIARADELGLSEQIEFRIGRLSDDEMALLFAETDVFLFPYRLIEASGVYYLVRPLGRWIIASRVGVFAEDLEEGVDGRTVPVGDVAALAEAMTSAVVALPPRSTTPRGATWVEIGRTTHALYREAAGL